MAGCRRDADSGARDRGAEVHLGNALDRRSFHCPPTMLPSAGPTIPETTVSSSSASSTAVTDLANRLGVDPATIVVIDEREVTWPDSSLGCPKPGMQYLQRLTPGVLIVLEANGQRHQYHAGGGRAPFLCTHPRPPVQGG